MPTDRQKEWLADVQRAERGVLGACLRDNPIVDDVLQVIRAEHFRSVAHRQVFAAIVALVESGKPADLVTVADWLHARGQMPDVGYPYLGELWDAAPTAANAAYHAGIVKDAALKRQLGHAADEIATAVRDNTGPADDLLETAERKIFALAEAGLGGESVPVSRACTEAFHRIDARCSRGQALSGLPTGFIDLDAWTSGLQPSELVVLAGRPSTGKTALALNIVRSACLNSGAAAFFVSLEQSRIELAERLLCMESHVNGHRLRQGNPSGEDSRKLVAAGDRLRQAKLFIDDTPVQGVSRIGASARRQKRRNGVGLVVIDYLQLIDPEDRRVPRHEQVGAITHRLKQLARDLAAPVLLLAQLNRQSEYRGDRRPVLADLRESGDIEQDADTVLLLYRDPEKVGTIDVLIAKQRNGPVGEVTLTFLRECLRFENHAAEPAYTANGHAGGGHVEN